MLGPYFLVHFPGGNCLPIEALCSALDTRLLHLCLAFPHRFPPETNAVIHLIPKYVKELRHIHACIT